ncbi:MAG: xylanase [Clostridia bacterium]|nr:xylanase [Clostridia bacterium]
MATLAFDREKTYQTIESFGVSGAWWAQTVGGWTEPDGESGLAKRERVAQLLFDREKGIGVTCYRYNLGSGSKNSGKGNYDKPSRRAESFDDGPRYDWSRDQNAVWFLKRAAEYGVRDLVLFVNSPPESMTKNGLGYQSRAGETNLARRDYRRFANYVLDVAEHFMAEGIPVRYISPVNEPVWFWTERQEGCHYRPWQVRGVMRAFADEMNARPAMREVLLSGAENGDVRWFNKTYCRVMLGDPVVRARINAIDTHSYCITPNIPVLKNLLSDRVGYLRRYRRFMDRWYPGVPLRTSEWTHMRGGRDSGMDSALVQALVMAEDLAILNVVSWQNWIAVSDSDYCDGLLYEYDDERRFEVTKRYYAFGNFSKFIVPGSVRIRADSDDGALTVLGFALPTGTAFVIVNPTHDEKVLTFPQSLGAGQKYTTSADEDLTATEAEGGCTLPPRSVVTLVFPDKREEAATCS